MVLPKHNVIVQAIELIESRTGIAVGKQYHHEFKDLFERLAQGNPASFLNKLQTQNEQAPEWQRVINTLTIGETYFLREENHYNILKKHILPKLVLRRRQQNNHHIRIWSAGCASGEEPYSIAIILHQFLPDLPKWNVEIYGTDLNEYALNTARHGVYRPWAFRDTDALFQQNYFNRVEGGEFKIKPFIQSMVTFRQHNLLQKTSLGHFDIIFCKNVMLYFDDKYIKHVENHLYSSLNSGGWLLLGQAEALHFERERWQTHIFTGAPIYQKLSSGTQPRRPEDISQTPNDNPIEVQSETEAYYELAVQAVHDDNNTLAEQYLSLALSNKKNLAASHTLLAWLFANRKAFPEAKAHIAATLTIDPLHADAHYVSALVAIENDLIEDAIRALHMTLYCDIHHMLATFMLGNVYAQTGDLPKAFNQWGKIKRYLEDMEPDQYISPLSDLTVTQLNGLINTHLNDI